jgi:hypothetical protein
MTDYVLCANKHSAGITEILGEISTLNAGNQVMHVQSVHKPLLTYTDPTVSTVIDDDRIL